MNLKSVNKTPATLHCALSPGLADQDRQPKAVHVVAGHVQPPAERLASELRREGRQPCCARGRQRYVTIKEANELLNRKIE